MHGHVLITGCSSGIGRACALRLCRAGWGVYAGVRRQEDADGLRDAGYDALRPLMLDVTDEASIQEAVATVAGETGEASLVGLVNNAGIAVPGPVEMLTSEDLRRQMEVNVVGVAAVTRACLPLLRRARGRIVNMSSVSGRIAYPFLGAYAASKFALEAMSDALRIELRPWDIRVILIEPGPVQTPIWGKGQTGYDDLRKEVPGELWALYAEAIGRFAEMVRQAAEQGISPEAIAGIVEKALTARRPRARYVPGIGTRVMLRAIRLVPAKLWDRQVARELGM